MVTESEVQQFMDVAGMANAEEARAWLESHKGNLNNALDAYLKLGRKTRGRATSSQSSSLHPPSDPLSTQPNVQKRSGNSRVTRSNGQALVPAAEGSKLPREGEKPPVYTIDEDEPPKHIKQRDKRGEEKEEEEEEDVVAEPMQHPKGILVPQTFRQSYEASTGPLRGNRRAANDVFEQYHDFQSLSAKQRQELADRAVAEKNGVRNGISAAASTSSSSYHSRVKKPMTRLQQLFRPPVELSYKGDWDEVLAEGKRTSRWLLINIQMAEEFACQVFNRDVWSDPTVHEVVKSNFLLWYVYHNSPDGIRVRGYYAVHSYPALFIVDPRTGELVKEIRAGDKAAFLDSLTSFLDEFPNFEAADKRHREGKGGHGVKSPEATNQARGRKRNSSPSPGDVEIADVIAVEAKRMRRLITIDDEDEGSSKMSPSSSLKSTESKLSSLDEYESHPTPQGEEDKPIWILMRLPDGKRDKLTLYSSTKLGVLLHFLKKNHAVDVSRSRLILNHPKRMLLLEEHSSTLRELGFGSQEVVYIESA